MAKRQADASEKKGGVGLKAGKLRRDSRFRLVVIIALMVIVAALFFFLGKFKIALAGIFILLMVALGMERSGTDIDLGKLVETGSLEESRITKSDGFWAIGDDCDGTVDYDCANFEYQGDAQAFYEQCGGVNNDLNALDGDKDGEACESLPAN
ncbi:hypothetical protein KC686_03415 [Candidatus Woesebacteria bacterium]|nr:hypothetical protein [Candidatus Woesebacteria bacterium]